jgi:hypothetical protein
MAVITPSMRPPRQLRSERAKGGCCAPCARLSGTWRTMVHFMQVESQIRNLTEGQLREHGLYRWQLAFKLAVNPERSQLSRAKKTLLRPILLYAIVGSALTMPYVAKVSRAGIESLRPINLMLSRAQLAL